MNSNVSTFVQSARDAGFTARYRDRDGKHTFTFSVAGNPPTEDEQDELEVLAFRAGLKLSFGKEAFEYVNARGEVTSTSTGTNANVERDDDGNLPRLPDYQYAVVKSLKAGRRAAARIQDALNSGNVASAEVSLLQKQLAAQMALNDVLEARVAFYGIGEYLN